MHDIDRALFESEDEEYGETESAELYEIGQPNQELALATELLEVSTEAELDRFLGNLLSGAVSAARGFARSDTGRAVGGLLKSAAKQALPHVGKAIGDTFSPAGGAAGRRAGEWLGGKLETEGLSAEDREYETAKAFVRFANETAQRAARAGSGAGPVATAQRAAQTAAQQHLPGLLRPAATTARSEGRWVRRGNRIVILDA